MGNHSSRLKLLCLSFVSMAWATVFLAVLALPQSSSGVDVADRGQAVFSAYCVSCHGAAGDASTPAGRKLKAADLRSDKVQKQSSEELFNGIAHGLNHKQYPHAFADRGLTDQQVSDVVVYIRGFARSGRSGKRP